MSFFSVVIPIYNAENTLLECLKSVRDQTFKDFEVVLVNDGSIDFSIEIIQNWLVQNPDQKHILIEQSNAGLGASRNVAITQSSSQYICFLDADDYWKSDKLESLHSCIQQNSPSLLYHPVISFAFLNGKGFSLTLSYKPVQILLIAFTLGGLYVSYNRLQGEKGAVKVLQYNKSRNAQRIIPAVDDAENSLYTLDNFSNPLRYYSSIGHLVLGQAQEAKEDLLIAEEHHPNNILVLNQMGNVLKTQNQTEEALAYYERAVEIAPLFEQALLNKAEIFIQRKDAVGAMSALERILPNSKNPKYREYMESVLPVLVAEREKHGKYKKLVAAIISKSPQTRQQYWQAYSSFKDQKRSNRNAKKVNKP